MLSKPVPPSSSATGTSQEHKWQRVASRVDIQRIADFLGTSKNEQLLRMQLISTFLSEKDNSATQEKADEEKGDAMEVEEKGEDEGGDDAEEGGASDNEDNEDEEGEEEAAAATPISSANASKMRRLALATAAAKAAGIPPPLSEDKIPVGLKLFPQKGCEVQATQVIAQETVFDDNSATDCGPDDDLNHREYFNFGKR